MDVNVPIANQRTQRGADGRPPEDGNMDCVPTSLGAMVEALSGTHVAGDDLHDALYGEGYVGMQDPARYVALLARKGLTLAPYTGTPAELVAHAIACIRARTPVLLSIPSDWDATAPHSPYAHMIAGCNVDSSAGQDWAHCTMTGANSWGTREDGYAHAAYQTETLDWWVSRLAACAYKATWVLTREGTMGVPNGWTDDAATGVLTAPNGAHVVRGFRDHILAAQSWNPALVPLGGEYASGDGSKQDFGLSLEWTASAGVTEHPGTPPAPAAPPPPAPADPKAAAALAVVTQFKTVLGEL